ncbi:hypothetical protein VU04_04005 [Desulfobulbus sp. TB]|nr:hypothetical protein [Desulfobulbus sp. TB]
MAKCSICNVKKGKRKCKADNTLICSLCCGQSRNQEKCTGCSFYDNAGVSRNYRKVPFYGTQQMADSIELGNIANVVESVFRVLDVDSNKLFRDSEASKLLELFFDKYHFKDETLQFADAVQEDNYHMMLEACEKDLGTVSVEKLIQVMAAVYRSIQRRTDGSRRYLQFIEQYISIRR